MNLTHPKRVVTSVAVGKLRSLIFLFGLLLVMGNFPFPHGLFASSGPKAGAALSAPPAGIDNFGKVDAHLYRGAQPEPAAYAELQQLGFDTVVRFNPEGQNMTVEKNKVESLGMRFVSIPWHGTGEPTREQVVAFLNLLRDDPNGKVFVHCRVGADRTGVMVALYRLTFSHWSMAQTLAEMRAFHYHHIWLPHLQRYVESFPATMASDRDLSQFGPPAPTRAPNSSN